MSLRGSIKVLGIVALLLMSGACALIGGQSESNYTVEQLQDLGQKFLAGGSLGQALKMLTQAESMAPNNASIQYDLGRAYEERGIDSQALEHYLKAVKIKPDFADAHNSLGAFYAKRGDLDNAEQHFKKALGNPFYDTPHMVYYNLGFLYEKKGETERALEQYREAVRLESRYGLAYYHIGQMLEILRRADEAKEAYGRAIEYTPDLAEAHFRYGVMSYMAGEMENAIFSLSRVVKLAPHTNMASEARRYLEKLQGVMGSGGSKSPKLLPSERISHLEVINDTREPDAPVPARKIASIPTTAAGADEEAKAQVEAPLSPPPGTQWTYIIQLGSFLDKGNAEILRQRLKEKGYNAQVKQIEHLVLGHVYIVQLSPVTDEVKANILMAQVESDERVKPIIIKVPACF